MIQFLQESPEEGGWHDLVSKGFIEYIDTEEEENTMISMTINVSIIILDLKKDPLLNMQVLNADKEAYSNNY